MPTIDAAGAVALDPAGRLLVIRRRNPPAAGRWSLPGGRVEPDETAADAVVREVHEETGLTVEVVRPLGVIHRPLDDGVGRYRITDFLVTVVGGTLRPGDDASDARWMGRTELEAADTTDGLLAFLDDHGVVVTP